MKFPAPLEKGIFLRRYKRFMADIRLPDGSIVTVHVPNSGSMKGCQGEGWPVLLSRSDRPGRKYPLTLEMIHNGRTWIGVNTGRTNAIVEEAILAGRIPELRGYTEHRREKPYGEKNSRIDLYLRRDDEECYVEVKSVTMLCGGLNCFPDAVTERGKKHLQELAFMKQSVGVRAVLFYLIQRQDGRSFRPAAEIDPEYARAMQEARDAGVEFLAYRAVLGPEGIRVGKKTTLRF